MKQQELSEFSSQLYSDPHFGGQADGNS